ncbi:MAG: hypothetical protein CMI27_07285 [Opitutae bacterium]|nr:hypothetical protein [Opitutae bacterium]|tara:strand:+ start:17848 stop:18765 length:918 start_codon:yes stop_codon:yes gene_type:complete
MNRKRRPDTRKQPEPTPFKSNAQKAYKRQRRKNDIYSTTGGHNNLQSGAPYNLKTKRAGTDRLRFEVLEVDPEGFPINDELEPRIWKGEELRPFISKKLIEIANDFIDGLPFAVAIKDVRFTGSLANYNWSKYSDIDLHIVVDFTELDENKDLVKEMFDAKRLRWNENHNITIKGYEVELYIEDEGEEHSSSGVYSVMNEEWLDKPERTDTKIDIDTAKKKASDIEQQIASISVMFDQGQFEKVMRHVDRLKKKIRTMRQAGLDTEAMEFSPENIAFKLLRRNDLLDTLTKLKYKAYDQSMTLDD